MNATLPPKLQEIIEKLLEKDRDLRYQSAADLRGDLKRLKRDVESGRKGAAPSARCRLCRAASSSAVAIGVVVIGYAARQPRVQPWSRPQGGTSWERALSVVLGIRACCSRLGIRDLLAVLTQPSDAAVPNFTVAKVTEDGQRGAGRDLARRQVHSQPDARSNGLASLWLRNVPTNSNTQVQPPADVYYNGLRFSPDGNYLYFVRSDPGNLGAEIPVPRAAAGRHAGKTRRRCGFEHHLLARRPQDRFHALRQSGAGQVPADRALAR